jgi:protein phosphatase 2C family protein 2/3
MDIVVSIFVHFTTPFFKCLEHEPITNFTCILIGDGCAEFLSKNLLKNVLQVQEKIMDEEKTILNDDEVIKQGFMNTDQEFANKLGGNDSGTTAVTTFLRKTNQEVEIICANTGDSRCVLYNEGKTEAMSRDHKPVLEDEKKRIKEAGGYVEFGRVNGTLAVSRAFGDLIYKENTQVDARKQAVTALPEIKRLTLPAKSQSGDTRFIVLACDGVWDVMSNEEVTKYVRTKLQEQKSGDYWKKKQQKLLEQGDQQGAAKAQPPSDGSGYDLGAICEDLLDHCVQELDSKDNVSVVIVLLRD